MQAQKRVNRWRDITLEVEGDADRFACEYLHEMCRTASDKGAAQGKNIRDEWNSGCDRLRLWQACCKLVSLESRGTKELGKLPKMKTWSQNGPQEGGKKLEAQQGGRRQTGQVAQCGCRCRKCGRMPTNDTMWLFMRKRKFKGSHKARTECCCAYCGAPSEHDNGTCRDTTQYGDEEETCVVWQAGYPPQRNCTVIEALIVAKTMCTRKMRGSERWEVAPGCTRGFRYHILVELAEIWKNMERV